MAAPVVELCDAVVAYIQGQTYSMTFNVERVNFVKTDLSDTVTTNVYVYPGQSLSSSTRVYDRGSFSRRFGVVVHITNFIDNIDTNSEIDNALLLTHEIEKSLENVNFGEMQMMQFESETSGREFFGIEQAQERNYFHTIITIDYEGVL